MSSLINVCAGLLIKKHLLMTTCEPTKSYSLLFLQPHHAADSYLVNNELLFKDFFSTSQAVHRIIVSYLRNFAFPLFISFY